MARCAQCGRKLPPFSFGKKICQWCAEYEAAQRGEVSGDEIQKVMPAPWAGGGYGRTVTQILLGINVAVFIGMALAGVSVTDPTSGQLVQWGANAAWLTLSGQWWRLVSSMFLHIGLIHIAFNMWCLWDLGALCESLYGPWTFLVVYFVSGVGGSLASAAWHPHGLSAGASGAIFGLAGALIASYSLGEFSLPRFVITSTLRSVLAFVAINLFLGFASTRTDNAAHGGGLVAGIIVGALIAVLAPDRRDVARRLLALVLSAAIVGGAWFWIDRTRGFEARVQQAEQLILHNRVPEAMAELQTIIRKRPDFAPAHAELAEAYLRLKQYSTAEAELKRVLELEPKDSWAVYDLGSIYLRQQRISEARNLYEAALRRNPNDVVAHFGRGEALAAGGDCATAIQEYELAQQLDSETADVYYSIGRCDLVLKKYDDAIAAFQKDQQENGDDPSVESALAEAYRAKGMTDKAQEAEHKAAQMQNKGTGE